ncbi:Ni/Fe hydrogenase subunit alpha [Planctomycetaceae bacterium SH139]
MSREPTRTIEIGALTRVEGEGALKVTIQAGQPAKVQLAIYEPPRFFEALLRGRPLEDAPDITARICGICPIAYQMSAVHALEQGLEINPGPEIRALRRLLYCGEWMESHGVHLHLLHIPDFFGCANSLELAKLFPGEVRRGLQLKKLGNTLLEIMGGRATHPINIAVGGFYKAPDRGALRALREPLLKARDDAVDVVQWVAGFEFPDFSQHYEMVALQHPDEYPLNEGRIVSTAGLDIDVSEFENYFEEQQVAHSTAMHAVRLPSRTPYHVGPLARVNLNRHQLTPIARQLSESVPIQWPCHNPYKSIVARALELVHAFDEAVDIIAGYDGCPQARQVYQHRSGEGCWATEAPRGLLYHRYQFDDQGNISFAKIIPPTSQNQWQIEHDLTALLPGLLTQAKSTNGEEALSDKEIGLACERLIRSYDPCISCATHFLELEIIRES